MSSEFLQSYRNHVAERAALGIPPLPLSAKQTRSEERRVGKECRL